MALAWACVTLTHSLAMGTYARSGHVPPRSAVIVCTHSSVTDSGSAVRSAYMRALCGAHWRSSHVSRQFSPGVTPNLAGSSLSMAAVGLSVLDVS